jgi:hypothetical protein
MLRLATSAVAAALLLGFVLSAPEASAKKSKKKPESAHKKLEGIWTKTSGDVKVVFQFKKHALRCTLADGDKKISADADYGMTKDGVVFGRVGNVEKTGTENGPAEGMLFSFRTVVKDGTLTISDLTGPGGDEAKQIVEGDYKGGAGKKKSGQ